MVGYIFIFLSVFSNGVKGYCNKQISNVIQTVHETININLLRNALCCLLSVPIVLFKTGGLSLSFTATELWIYLVSGISMAVFVLSWMFAIKSDAYMLVSACASASFIVPCLFGLFMLNERFTTFKLISFMLILIALYFLLRYNISLNGKISKTQLLLLGLVLLSQGFNQTMQKLFVHYVPDKDVSLYTLYSFVATFAVLLLSKPFFKAPPHIDNRKTIKDNLVHILLMALGLFGASYFQSLAAAHVDAIILYPMVNALSLITGSTMASLFFKEKMRRDCVIGIILVFFSLVASRV